MSTFTVAATILSMAVPAEAGFFALPSFLSGNDASRSLAASQLCLDETDGLFEDPNMVAAYEAVVDEIEEEAGCTDPVSGKSTCEVDFDAFEAQDGFAATCEATGGIVVEVDAVIDCGYAVSQITRDQITVNGFEFTYNGLTDCVAIECEDDSVEEKVQESIAKAAASVAQSTGATCTYRMENFQVLTVKAAEQDNLFDGDVCVAETHGLFEDSSLMAAFEDVSEEIDTKASCSGLDLTKQSCEVDFAAFESASDFIEACETMGGVAIHTDVEIDCGYVTAPIARQSSITVNGFAFTYDGLMDCVASECEMAGVTDNIEAEVKKAVQNIQARSGSQCTYIMGDVKTETDGSWLGGGIDIGGAMDAAGGDTPTTTPPEDEDEDVVVVDETESGAQYLGSLFAIATSLVSLLVV